MIEVMNLRKVKPKHRYDVIVDRRSPLGNPFTLVDETKRRDVCRRYEIWLMREVRHSNQEVIDALSKLAKLHHSFGKLRLFCWCAPKECHANVIKNFIRRVERGGREK